MRKLLWVATVVGMMCGLVGAAENYAQWGYYRTLTITSPSGVTESVANFPFLVRLNGKIANGGTANDSLVFAKSMTSGQDIRFGNDTTLTSHYTYQIEKWDAVNLTAAIWVTIPALGISGTVYNFRMYFGNITAVDNSSSVSVFDTAKGFQAVWHMNDTGNGDISDATINANTGTKTVGNNGLTPIDSAKGMIGGAKQFLGNIADFANGGYFSNSSTTLEFADKGPYTISTWFIADTLSPTSTSTNRPTIFAKAEERTAKSGQYYLTLVYKSPTQSTFEYGDYGLATPTGEGVAPTTGPYVTPHTWHHVACVRNGSIGQGNINLYIDGTVASSGYNSNAVAVRNVTAEPFCIGGHSVTNNKFFRGMMDEFRAENVARSASWINLCYSNQITGSTVLTFGAPLAQVLGGLTYVSNPASYNVSIPVTTNVLSYNGVADSFTVSPALPAGLSLSKTTGAITGTPTGVVASASYTITGWSSSGNATVVLVLAVNASPIPFAPVLTSPAANAVNVSSTPSLTWTSNSNGGPAANYFVKVSTASNFSSTVINDSTLGSITTYAPVLAMVTKYYWEVSAKNINGQSSWSVDSFTTIVGTPALTAPATGSNGLSITPTLSWGTVVGAVTYRVQVSTISTFATTVINDSTLTAGTKALTGLSNSTTYYWRANAKGPNGAGAWSSVWNFGTIIAVPVTPALTTPTTGTPFTTNAVNLSWGTVNGAATYRVQVSTSSTFATMVVDDSVNTTATEALTGLLNGTYYWRTSATNIAGTSAWSAPFSFTITVSGIASSKAHYVSAGMGHNGVLEVYMANGCRVMQIAYSAVATKSQLLKSASLSLAKGYYTYRFRSADAKVEIIGKLIK